MTEFEDKLKKRIKEHDVAMTGLHNQGFVNGLKVALDLFETTDELSVEKLQEQLNTAKKALTEIAEIINYDIHECNYGCDNSCELNGSLDMYSVENVQSVIDSALAAIGNKGSGDE